jgi:branched-chain amino acid aminotransferase
MTEMAQTQTQSQAQTEAQAEAQASQAETPSTAPSHDWTVRSAGHEDVEAVAEAVRELLLELGGTPCERSAMQAVARALIDDPTAGAVLLAEADGALVGVLASSWQMAIHVPGTYALIQDLWVHPDWRGRSVGGGLIAALSELARGRGAVRVEVGLPRESFPSFAATEAFYVRSGFTANGPRMRLGLS